MDQQSRRDFNGDPRPASVKTVALPVVRWFRAYTDGAMTIAEELNRFAHDQTQRNFEAMLALTSQIANPVKLVESQEQWLFGSLRAMGEESQRLTEIGSKVTRECAEANKR